MTLQIERSFCGPAGEGYTRAEIDVKLRHAPQWFRDRVAEHRRASLPTVATTPKAAQPASNRPSKRVAEALAKIRKGHVGWIAGCVAPGLSVPCYSSKDAQTLREQFTPRAWQSIVEQISDPTKNVPLVWRHGGQVIAQGPDELSVRIHKHYLVGLVFEARLRSCAMSEIALGAIKATGCGVSIGYGKAEQWHTERKGVGKVRVVDHCIVDHIALVPTGEGRSPAYPGARAYAARSKARQCPTELASEAEAFAWQEVRSQLLAMP